jgi:cold shock CspA family protein
LGSGSVKSFNDLSGHGVIVSDDAGVDLWVHQRNIVSSPATLREGDRVEFEDRQAGMGPEAINVRSLLPVETSKTLAPDGSVDSAT